MDNEKTLAKRKIFAGAIKGAFDKALGSAFKTLGLNEASGMVEGGVTQTSKGSVQPAKNTKWADKAKSAENSVTKEELRGMESLGSGQVKDAKASKWERFLDELGLNREMSSAEYEEIMIRQMQEEQIFGK